MRVRMMMFLGLVALAGVPCFALPDYSVYRTFWDTDGNQIGTYILYCNGGVAYTVSSSEYYQDDTEPCNVEFPPITCADVGLATVGACGSPFCVSQSYGDMYAEDILPDCAGGCTTSENYYANCNGHPCGCHGDHLTAYHAPRRPKGARGNQFMRGIMLARVNYPKLEWQYEQVTKGWKD